MGAQKLIAPKAKVGPKPAPARLIQTLRVGAANDPAEREAEAMAARVLRGAPAGIVADTPAAPPLRRAEQPNTDSLTEPAVPPAHADFDLPPAQEVPAASLPPEGLAEIETGKPLETPSDLAPLRPRALVGREGGPAPAEVAARVATPGAGHGLPEALRQRVEPAFGRDFSEVRVHDAPADRKASAAIGARAFAHGRDIWLGPGESPQDLGLMAHELTHVVQQTDGSASLPLRRAGYIATEAEDIARHVPGYTLITVLVGQKLITGDRVEMTATNLMGGLFGLVPGGTAIFDKLNETRALDRAFDWVKDQLTRLDITWTRISRILDGVLDAVASFSPLDNLIALFRPLVRDILTFVGEIADKVLEFILQGALKLAGPYADRVWAILQSARESLSLILQDPLGFAKNLVRAVIGGFGQFATNIVSHLKKGLLGWLFGAFGEAGIQMPERLDFKGLLSLLLQIVGLTYANFRAILVKRLGPRGERIVSFIEKSVEVAQILMKEGFAGLWQKILQMIEGFKQTILGGLAEMVTSTVVKAGISWLAGLSNPIGAVVKVVLAIYDLVVAFLERLDQILQVAQSIFSSIGAIARGQTQAAADFVEQTIGRTVPVVISFLAALLGLNGISAKIRAVFERLQAPVKRAMERLVDFVIKKAQALMSKAVARVNRARKLPGYAFRIGETEHHIFARPKGKKTEVAIASDEGVAIGPTAQATEKATAEAKDAGSKAAAAAFLKALIEGTKAVKPLEAVDNSSEKTPAGPAVQKGAETLQTVDASLQATGKVAGEQPGLVSNPKDAPGVILRAQEPRLVELEGKADAHYAELRKLAEGVVAKLMPGQKVSDFYELDHTIEKRFPKAVLENLAVMKTAPADAAQSDLLRAGAGREKRARKAGEAAGSTVGPKGESFGLIGTSGYEVIKDDAPQLPAIALYRDTHIARKGRNLLDPAALIAQARAAHPGDASAVAAALRKGLKSQLETEIKEIEDAIGKDPNATKTRAGVEAGLKAIREVNTTLYGLTAGDAAVVKASDQTGAGQGSDFFAFDAKLHPNEPDYAKVEGAGHAYGDRVRNWGRYFEYDHVVDKAYPDRAAGLKILEGHQRDALAQRAEAEARQADPAAKGLDEAQSRRLASLRQSGLFTGFGMSGYDEGEGFSIPVFATLAPMITRGTGGAPASEAMYDTAWAEALPDLAAHVVTGDMARREAGAQTLRAGVRQHFTRRSAEHLAQIGAAYIEDAARIRALNEGAPAAETLIGKIQGNLIASGEKVRRQDEILFGAGKFRRP